MSVDLIEIEIEMDQQKKLEFDIISKAFDMELKDFINIAITHEIHYIKSTFSFKRSKEQLEFYYKRNINMNELKKLILVEEIF